MSLSPMLTPMVNTQPNISTINTMNIRKLVAN
jgi:hypothetical protein